MAYTKPTLQQLIEAVKADLFSRFPDLNASLVNSFAADIAEVIAGTNYGLYGYLDFILKQVFPDTAVDEFAERWGAIIDIPRRAAANAAGNATFTGTIGSSVSTGALLTASNGIQYEVVTGFTLALTSEAHAVQAVTAGEDGNIGAAAVLSFVSVPAGIDSTATVDGSGLTGGLDLETNSSYTERILAQFASPPKGGKAEDYQQWATEATDVTRSFIFTFQAPGLESVARGQVLLYFAMDNDYSDGIPAAGDVTDVQTYIDLQRPLASVFTAAAPTGSAVNFTVSITPDTPSNQTATETELAEMIRTAGGVGTSITLSDIFEAMSIVPDLTSWSVASPASPVTTAAGELHTMGTVTFT